MQRRADWEKRLYEFIESRRDMPFAWGTNDCACFAADWVLEATGVDLMTEWRGKYKSAEEVRKFLQPRSLASIVDSKLIPCPVLSASRGDIGMVDRTTRREGPALCIVDSLCVVGPGENGLVSYPRSVLIKAWRV